jgi:3-hydroxybutyryl-CoA dehydrogenase
LVRRFWKKRQEYCLSAGKLIEKGKAAGPLEAVMGRIATTTDTNRAAEADLCLEAVFEKLEVKQEIFARFEAAARPEALLASNTSAISISTLAAGTRRPEKVLGLHFFSPAPMMEAWKSSAVNLPAMEPLRLTAFCPQIGKEPILVHKDVPGFLINRINFPAAMEAMRLVEMGVAGIEDVERGCGWPPTRMGIFETGDLVGLTNLGPAGNLRGDQSRLLVSAFAAEGPGRWLGRKTGRGGMNTRRRNLVSDEGLISP